MTKLHQIIALVGTRKQRAAAVITEAHHKLQKKELLSGIARSYRPKNEDGEQLPPESKRPQYSVKQSIADVSGVLRELFDTIATQDNTNCIAAANLIVDGKIIVAGVPVTHLLFLEKQLTDLHTFVAALPTLDPAYVWTFDAATGAYRSAEAETFKTAKVLKNHVKYDATKEHPAQVEVFTEDTIVGFWSKVDFSGAIPATEQQGMLARVRKLKEAVTMAREEANGSDVSDLATGKPILEYIFGSNSAV